MKIGIRADGGSQIGMGHIMRTLVLAKELAKTEEVFYICRIEEDISKVFHHIQPSSFNIVKEASFSHKYKNGIEKVLRQGFNVKLVSEDNLIQDLKNIKMDLLITDSYHVDEDYFNKTKAMFSKTAYIDDVNLYYFNVDFLINQNINAEDFNYKANKDTKLILGSKYVMLRDEFTKKSCKAINKKVRNVMITLGGADPNHITEKILLWTKDLEYNFHVVIGPSFDNCSKIKEFQGEKVKLYYNANMYEIMQICDIAISACGSTLYELAACGLPTIGMIIADNQQKVGEKMHNLGVIKNVGWFNKVEKEEFIKVIQFVSEDYNLRKNMSKNALKIIDGDGAKRIAAILLSSI